jgi:pyruvate/2-oxoglutarate dehydrogenase complex dihydrolipoamide acyltransferase (E2) component
MTFDVAKISHNKHYVTALLEVDVTDAWEIIRQQRRDENRFSFIAWLIKVTADSLVLHPQAAGFNLIHRGKVLVFEDADISVVVEKEVDGTRVPLPYLIRAANKKTILQIHQEIEAAKVQPITGEGNYVLGKSGSAALMKAYLRMPQWLRVWGMKMFMQYLPGRMKDTMGNVAVTTAGMVGHTHGWIIPTSMHPLCLAFGTINEQARVHRGEIAKRRVLHLTALFDHDAIDGAPAGRFMDGMVQNMEAAYGLQDLSSKNEKRNHQP